MFGNAEPQIPENGDAQVPFRLLYPLDEVAVLLGGITERQVHRYIAEKRLKSTKLGRRRLVHRDWIAEFIEHEATVDAA
ncbi:helix-turn-helix domain-containing protein [Micromonospora sp. NPDC005299]|uniref:helix-turn-helix domain-containing protein n=1 Tax=Micromonospora sp. NPDC005299 TaxID=3364231 RepID=UPI0036C768CC